jgi:hypothetical protein
MVILAPNGPTNNVVIEILNFWWRENLPQHFKWKGLKFAPHIQITQRVLIDFGLTTPKPFDKFHYKKD